MSVISNNQLAGAAGQGGAGFKIDRSLRFNDDDTAHLSRTFSVGNRKTWTWSGWVKRSKLSGEANFFSVGASSTEASFRFNDDDTIKVTDGGGSELVTNAKFRDPSAWYHIIVALDSTQSTEANRFKLYVNGVEQTYSSATYSAQNTDSDFNTAVAHYFGRQVHNTSNLFDGYLAEVHWVDGQALAPTDFGEYDDNNVWQPKKFGGSYNASGFTPGANISYGSWADVFNGSTTGHAFTYTSGATGTSTATLSPGIAWSSKVRIYGLQYTTSHVKINGGSALTGFSNTAAWVDVTSQVGSSGTLSSVQISDVSTNYFKLFAIELDDTILDLSQAGVNGFHLNFSDNSTNAALGTDSSGNSNTWTVNNLTAAGSPWDQSRTWSGGSATGSLFSGAWAQVFNGVQSNTYSDGNSVYVYQNTATLNFSPALPTGAIQIWGRVGGSGSSGDKVTFSDGTNTYTTGDLSNQTAQWIDVDSGNSLSGITSVTVHSGGSSGAGMVLGAIKIGSNQLVNSGVFDTLGENIDSLIDTPTNYEAASGNNGGNYATLNPLDRNDSPTYSQGNLVTTGSGAAHCVGRATVGVSSGKWYWEVQINSAINSTYYPSPGIASMEGSVPNQLGDGTTSHAYMANGQKYTSATLSSYGASFAQNDIIGFALDMDAGTLVAYKNGTSQGTMATGLTGTWSPTAGHYSSTSLVYNFGQRPFAYTPPTGYKSLCTTNLTDPTIADGSTAFDIVTWSGAGGSGDKTITGLNLSDAPDLVWSKTRNHGYHNVLFDNARGFGASNALITDYQGASDAGRIKSTTASSITWEQSGSGRLWFDESSKTYVAWTWDGGDLATNSAYNQSQVWSNDLTASNGSFSTSATDGFNGAQGNNDIAQAASGSNPNTVSFQPTGGIAYSTNVEVYITNAANEVSFNSGAYQTISANTWVQIASGSGTVSSIVFQRASTNGASFAGIKVDGKELVDSGLIPPGGLNSSAYSYDNWTSMVTGNYSSANNWGTTYQTLNAFDGDLSTMVIAHGTDGWKFEPTNAIAGDTIEIYGWNDGCPNAGLKINGNNYGDALGADQTTGAWYTLPYSTLSSIEMAGDGSAGSSEFRLIAIRIDGKILIQNNQSPPNVPTIASTVRANPSAGFSIVKYTGSGSVGTIAHGLSAAPDFILAKNYQDLAGSWMTYHSGYPGGTHGFNFQATTGVYTDSGYWNGTGPDSNVITLGSYTYTAQTWIAYCWSAVEGYSSFGKYTGNGSADGPFIYTGFKVKYLLLKQSSAGGQRWYIQDVARDINPNDAALYPNSSDSEYSSSSYAIDFLSNGFKVRNTNASHNTSGATYIYAAFASHPLQTARAS